MEFRIDLQDFTEEIFIELENINQSGHGHELVISEVDDLMASRLVCRKLIPFFQKHFKAVKEQP